MKKKELLVLIILLFLILVFSLLIENKPGPIAFNAQRSYQDIALQLSFGPRTPGSEAHETQLNWMEAEISSNGWQVERQETESLGHTITNLIAKSGQGSTVLLLGAHYDSRLMADRDSDPNNHSLPVPGANDGASGVAVLMELSRIIPKDLELSNSIWQQAEQLGYSDTFISDVKFNILDDHIPFRELGIPAVDIIDIEYTYWHTIEDTLVNVSSESLQIVGDTLLQWILNNY
jgi:hypothetical protein